MPLEQPMPTIQVDTREQDPWTFAPWPEVHEALPFGDYCIRGHMELLVVERKSAEDFVSSVTVNHDTEWNKQARARDAGVPLVYVIEAHRYECLTPEILRTKSPATVTGAVNSMIARGFPVIFAGSRKDAIALSRAFFEYHWNKIPMKVRRGA
jgi:ERCC4-type nuclease